MIKQQRLASCIAFLVSGIAASSAFAQSPVSNVSADVYGQINHGIMVGDTGDGSEHYIVDNDNSATRTGVKLSGDLKDVDLTVGAHVELGTSKTPPTWWTPTIAPLAVSLASAT